MRRRAALRPAMWHGVHNLFVRRSCRKKETTKLHQQTKQGNGKPTKNEESEPKVRDKVSILVLMEARHCAYCHFYHQ
jgi:hypothetical protein